MIPHIYFVQTMNTLLLIKGRKVVDSSLHVINLKIIAVSGKLLLKIT